MNAFKFTNAKGQSNFLRYPIVPVAGERCLSDADTAKAPSSCRMDGLPARIAQGPATFRPLAQLADAGDTVNGGSMVWPPKRKLVELATIGLAMTAVDPAKNQKALLFNPLTLTASTGLWVGPVLLIRPAAYGVSLAQRPR